MAGMFMLWRLRVIYQYIALVAVLPKEVPVFILAGGLGTRLSEETDIIPKPMVEIGGKPILMHIIRYYASYGFKRFIVCTGYKASVINNYFASYKFRSTDFEVQLGTGDVNFLRKTDTLLDGVTVTCCFTGDRSMTGYRLATAASRYLENFDTFALTYGDGLTDADLSAALAHHLAMDKEITLLAVKPPSRFGEFKRSSDGSFVFDEKPHSFDTFINGGYMFVNTKFLRRINLTEEEVLETGPLKSADADGQLNMFCHNGFWQCMDTLRDKTVLEKLLFSGSAPWIR